MTHALHIYAFGSLCRGEISPASDIDLLAAVTGANELSRSMFSIYSHRKLARIWAEGNPFSWHLHLEAKLIFASDGTDFLLRLGRPAKYTKAAEDCARFLTLFRAAHESAKRSRSCIIFDLSAAFLGLRNFSSCLLLGRDQADFSRNVALKINDLAFPGDPRDYKTLEQARLLCTRGYGALPSTDAIESAIKSLPFIEIWMTKLFEGSFA